MVKLGEYNTLRVVKLVDFGVYLDGEDWGEILLPKEYVPVSLGEDDEIKVFIYFDSEDRIIATTEIPTICAGEFSQMKVVANTPVGTFMDWGLRKDLFIPFREQNGEMFEGNKYIVYAYVDESTNRIVGSTKIDKFISKEIPNYDQNEKVEIICIRESDLGYNVIVDNKYNGLLYRNQVFTNMKVGIKTEAYIKEVREDGKIDLSLYPIGYGRVEGIAANIMEKLFDYGGVVDISDKSDPMDIQRVFGCSKRNYKMAVGYLMRRGLIRIEKDCIRLIPSS